MSDKLEALKEAAEKYSVTLKAHQHNPKDFDALVAWDTATSEITSLINNDEISIITSLLAALEVKTKSHAAAIEQMHFHEKRAEAAEKELQQRLQQPIKLPELDSDLIDILGRPNFACIRISQRLRELGYEIKRRSENEQAATLHFLLSHYLADNKEWRNTAEAALIGDAAKVKGE
ncbi:hypothetical protein [Serratia fonticola]|uniref:hypothetical protein n=1 Tax=Serratia fonticola TaxID=47917 RepID=UPI00301DD134